MSSLAFTPLAISACVQLTQAISRSQQLADIYGAALDALDAGLQVTRASVLLFDADGVMRFKAWRGLSDAYRRGVDGHTPWQPGATRVQPIVVPNVDRDADLSPYLPALHAEGIAALAFVPLEGTRGVIGTLMLYCDGPREFAPAQLELAMLIAAQVAFAVERTVAHLDAARSEERLRFALDAARMGTWEWDLREQRIRWSDSLERIHGIEPGSFDGQFDTFVREIHPEDRERVVTSIQRAVAGSGSHDVEYRILTSDGDVRWLEGKGLVESDLDGQPVRMTGVCTDVTDRKRAEHARTAAIEDSNRATQWLAAIIRSSDDAIVSKDLDGVISSWNGGAERMFGYPASEAIGRSIRLIVPDDRQQEEDTILRSIRAGQSVELETVRRHKRGDEVAVSLTVSPIRSIDGLIVGASKVARDITGRKRYEVERAALHEELRAEHAATEAARRHASFLAQAAAVLSRSLDYEETLDVVTRLAVPEIADWCGVDIADDSGRLERLATSQTDNGGSAKAALQAVLEDVVRTGRAACATTPRGTGTSSRDRSGSSWMCVPLVSPRGTLGAMTFVVTGTDRCYDEQDLAFVQSLASHAALAIDNATAYRRAHEANRLKDDFLATLSHELRTPLNAILGYAQMLNTGVLSDERRGKAMTILARNAESLEQIIDDVLEVSRITSGKLRLNLREVDLAEVVKAAAATVQPTIEAKRLTLRTRIDPDLPPVLADPDRIQQILWNLLSNAVKFTRAGEIELGVRRCNDSLEVTIRDTGRGIEASFLPQVFERFRQADSSFSREHGGLGLGLAIVHELVEMHGGTVAAESDGLDHGTTFRVTLPVMRWPAHPGRGR